MLTNRHPADELALVRAMMGELKRREAELRARLLSAEGRKALCGSEYRAVIRDRRDRVFCKERLPPGLREDPALYRVRSCATVTIKPVCDDSDCEVIERI